MNTQIKHFLDQKEFIETPFYGTINAHCLERELEGDFHEIVDKLILEDDITEVSIEKLNALNLSDLGNIARQTIINDYNFLKDFGADPTINLLKCYERDDAIEGMETDVYSYHVDASPVETQTFLCTYFGAASDIIENDKATQKILIPEIRKKIFDLFDGPENEFEAFLEEFHFHLHYKADENAKPTNLGIGKLWKLAVQHPNQKVLPCVHRAPFEDNKLRLLIIC